MIPIPKRITVTKETKTCRNVKFHDNFKNKDLTTKQFVREIKKGNYNGYAIRNDKGVETPVSKPDKSKNNNLG